MPTRYFDYVAYATPQGRALGPLKTKEKHMDKMNIEKALLAIEVYRDDYRARRDTFPMGKAYAYADGLSDGLHLALEVLYVKGGVKIHAVKGHE